MTTAGATCILLRGERLSIVRALVVDALTDVEQKREWYKGGRFRAELDMQRDDLLDLKRYLGNPEPEQSGLTVGSGLDSANVSEDVTGDRERIVGDVMGEIDGHAAPEIDDPITSSSPFLALIALKMLLAIAPENALDDDDPEQVQAWAFARAVVAKLELDA